MTCEEAREWLSADLDGEAGWRERLIGQCHLAVCQDCRRTRTAAMTLQGELNQSRFFAPDLDRDEALLDILRQEGFSHGPDRSEAGCPSQNEVVSASEIQAARGMALLQVCWHALQPQPVTETGDSPMLRPALAAMAAALLLTWSSLRWADTRATSVPQLRGTVTAVLPRRAPASAVLDQWMAGPPTLAALTRLQQSPGIVQPSPAPSQRGAAPARRRQTG